MCGWNEREIGVEGAWALIAEYYDNRERSSRGLGDHERGFRRRFLIKIWPVPRDQSKTICGSDSSLRTLSKGQRLQSIPEQAHQSSNRVPRFLFEHYTHDLSSPESPASPNSESERESVLPLHRFRVSASPNSEPEREHVLLYLSSNYQAFALHRISKPIVPSKGKTHTSFHTIHSQPARPLQLTH